MPKRVLIVDDVEQVARHLRRLVLQAAPSAAVEVFSDADVARRCAGDTPFDLAVLDLNIGPQSGVVLARDLLVASPRLKIVFVTGETGSPQAAEARALAPVAILEKPFAGEALKTVVRHALETAAE
jgi:DNA-binding NtrC family response regulator